MGSSNILKFKKNAGDMLKQMKDAAEKQTKKGGHSDSRFWKPVFDKEKGVGSAIIRFLPSVDDDMLPWVKIFYRNFKGPSGRWYIENDLSTIGRDDDPVFDLSRRCYNSGIESDKKGSSFLKRKTKFISNVLVISDPANPKNNGQVFLYEYGNQIFDLLKAAREPKFEDQVALEPFDPFHGANFRLRIVGKTVGEDIVPNYEQSTWDSIGAIASTDDEVVSICEKAISLKEFIAADKFSSPEELKRKLFEVLGPSILSGIETVPGWGEGTTPANKPDPKPAPKSTPKPSQKEVEAPKADADVDFNEDVFQEEKVPEKAVTKPISDIEDEDVEDFMNNLLNN